MLVMTHGDVIRTDAIRCDLMLLDVTYCYLF